MGLKYKLYKTYFKIFCGFYKRSKLNSSYAALDSGVWGYWGGKDNVNHWGTATLFMGYHRYSNPTYGTP